MKVFFVKPKPGDELAKKAVDKNVTLSKVDSPAKKHKSGDELKALKDKKEAFK
jgi:hypothetical protein